MADSTLRNTTSQYSKLSSETAQARRDGHFPDLLDNTRNIKKYRYFHDVEEAIEWTARIYRRDRCEGQPINLYVGVEKRGLVQQLQAWFGGPFGIPILPLGGYASQSFVDKVRRDIIART